MSSVAITTTKTPKTRKSAASVQKHFNPRLLIRKDRVNVALATQGIDVTQLDDYDYAQTAFGIPRISVHQDNYTADILLENLKNVVATHGAFCRGITPEYVKKSFRDSDAVLYIKNQQHPYDILGFITMSIIQDDLYVDLICTNQNYMGMGRYMIDRILILLKDVLGLRQITLCATEAAKSFYEHMGFEKTKNDYYCEPVLKKMVLRHSKTRRLPSKAKSKMI